MASLASNSLACRRMYPTRHDMAGAGAYDDSGWSPLAAEAGGDDGLAAATVPSQLGSVSGSFLDSADLLGEQSSRRNSPSFDLRGGGRGELGLGVCGWTGRMCRRTNLLGKIDTPVIMATKKKKKMSPAFELAATPPPASRYPKTPSPAPPPSPPLRPPASLTGHHAERTPPQTATSPAPKRLPPWETLLPGSPRRQRSAW